MLMDAAEHELKQYRDHLEEMVKARTCELEEANARLQQEIDERRKMEAALRESEEQYRSLFESLREVFYRADTEGNILLTSPSIIQLLGYTQEEATDLRFAEDILASSEQWQELLKLLQKDGQLEGYEVLLKRCDGSVIWGYATAQWYTDTDGKILGIEGLIRDITEQKETEANLDAERRLLRTMIDNLPDCIFVKDIEGRFVLNNLAYIHIVGKTTPEELIGKTDFDVFPSELAFQYHASDLEVIQSGQPVFNQEEWMADADNNKQWFLSTRVPLRDKYGKIIGLVGISRDYTVQKRAQEAQQQHTRELNLLNHMGNLLQACPTEEDTYSVMGSICKLLFPTDVGYLSLLNASRTELQVVMSWGESRTNSKTFGAADCWAFRLDTTHLLDHPDTGLLCPHVDAFPEQGYLCAPLSTSGDPLGILHLRFGAFDQASSAEERREMREAKRMMVNRVVRHYALFIVNLRLRETLRVESIRDPLTGLYNRRHMEASLEREAHRAERLHAPVGLMMLDVDHFKKLNDTYGHETGDIVLQQLGEVLRRNVRGEDIACRYGGEEFLLILPDAPLEHVRKRAEVIREKIKRLRIAYQHEALSITVSIGVAGLPEHGLAANDALKAADKALYQAKADGRDRVVVASAPIAP